MEQTRDKLNSPRSLSDWIMSRRDWPWQDCLRWFRLLVVQVQTLHESGRIHRAIEVAHVTVNRRAEPELAPPPTLRRLGGECSDPDYCPPELCDRAPVDVPESIEAAAALLRHESAMNPRRIDVYQLAVLLCRLVAGQSVLGYLYDVSAKRRVPEPVRMVLDEALGFDPNRRIQDSGGLLGRLDEMLRHAAQATMALAAEETPRHGSILGPASELPSSLLSEGSAAIESLPERLGHYRILECIGHGGMGEVYRAHDESLDRHVAIKVLSPGLARDDEFRRRFHAEASAAAKLFHPNVVGVHFIGEEAGRHFFAMEYVEGESLSQMLARSGRLAADQALKIAADCLSGLAAAHAQGLIHRDVKPGNILLERTTGRAVVADFGLVRVAGRTTRVTATGMIMGTVDYLAPEQARGQVVDARADIYSLGVVFYQMLSGRLPFDADTAAAMIFQHAYEAPLPLSSVAANVPDAVVEIVTRMMAKAPAERYASCREALDDVQAACEGRPIAPRRKVIRASGPTTRILPAPEALADLQAPEVLNRLIGRTRLGRMRDWAATMFRRHAPAFVKELQSTTQWVDSAVAEYDRRCRRLSRLSDEAREIVAELTAQIEETRRAAQQAAEEAESAPGEEERWKCQDRQQACLESLEPLQAQLEVQQRHADEIDLQLSKAQATLARLRSQRDLLRARMKSAEVRRAWYTVDLSGRRSILKWFLPSAVLTSLLAACFLAWYLERPRRRELVLEPRRIEYLPPYQKTRQQPSRLLEAAPAMTEEELARRRISNSISMELMLVPAGEFLMGTDRRDIDLMLANYSHHGVIDEEHGPNESPIHRVRITKSFYLGKYEVTQAEYFRVMGKNPSKVSRGMGKGVLPQGARSRQPSTATSSPTLVRSEWISAESARGVASGAAATRHAALGATLPTSPLLAMQGVSGETGSPAVDGKAAEAPGEFANHPVDSVPWNDAVEFCRRLSDLSAEKKAGRVYRLPTEAEWEYACRAGSATPFNTGNNYLGAEDANVLNVDKGTRPVGSYRCNALGLCDMHGNVWEWCEDVYSRDFYALSPTVDPKATVPKFGDHVMRGGAFSDPQIACRSAFRAHAEWIATDGAPFGFRVACDVKPAAP